MTLGCYRLFTGIEQTYIAGVKLGVGAKEIELATAAFFN
jgi:hypothetical protein